MDAEQSKAAWAKGELCPQREPACRSDPTKALNPEQCDCFLVKWKL